MVVAADERDAIAETVFRDDLASELEYAGQIDDGGREPGVCLTTTIE
jgi:hypothetical protein